MKIGLHIPPSQTNTVDSHLLLEIRDNGFSVLWYLPQPLVVTGYSVYQLEPFESIFDGLNALKSPLTLDRLAAHQILLYYNTRNCTYLPNSFANNQALHTEIIQLINGAIPDSHIYSSSFSTESITQIFSISKDVKSLTDSICPSHTPEHTLAKLEQFLPGETVLYCHVFYDYFNIMLRKNGKWQIFQQFFYQTPEDISYYLLLICEKHGMEVASTPLLLSGMITQESNLYQQLYNFFIDISFLPLPEGVTMEPQLSELPPHFITPLTYLAKCAS